jgi:subtilisin-like proprotein convertase family protein
MDLAPSVTQNTWTLELLDTQRNVAATLNSWSLIATPRLSITPNPKGNDPNPNAPRTYRVHFPMQSLSGTYTVQLDSSIASAAGDKLDSNLNAGLEVLRGGGTNVDTTPVNFSGPGLPRSIPLATTDNKGVTTPGQLLSTINVPDNFTVQGVTAQGLPGLTVQLNISGARDPDLEASLVYHFGQTDQVIVPLFNFDGLSPVGNVGTNQSGFQDTVFTDLSPTPIQNGGAPFFGTTGFRSQNPLLSSSSYTDAQGVAHFTPGFTGVNVGGAWTLMIKDHSASGSVGKLNGWSLTFQKPLPSTGLGEPVADRASTSFRIFTMDATNPLSSDVWTAVGPAGIGGSGGPGVTGSGRIGGLAVDPSDPSGNTVFTGGASGGIWKTTNFLDPDGPTWIPLTDFGPTFSLNIGSIAVFPRNNDPRQSIVIGATGEGDTASPGVGFLISKDGGATWNLYDSRNNVDASGNLLPINSPNRDHVFVGDSAFKVIVDPKLSANGEVIIYAAMSGPNGGIWRSQDTGKSWQLMRAGQATDVTFSYLSGTGAPNGNLQIIYAGFRGEGVFLSPNQGQVWNLMAGNVGNPLLINNLTQRNINPATQPSPNGALGRIQLAAPTPIPNQPDANLIYQGWLYAAVISADGHLSGLYLTKDFGQNWTKVRIPTLPPVASNGLSIVQAVPTNDVGRADYDIGGGPPGSGLPAQGNYDVSLALDPTNPNIVYLGGTRDGQSTGFLRIDATNLWDAHNATPYDEDGILGGSPVFKNSTGPMALGDITRGGPSPRTNVIGYPNGYIGRQFIPNGSAFTNNGAGVKWIPFDLPEFTAGTTDQHRILTMVDPITGHARLIIGDDQGVFTGVDNNGEFQLGIGTQSTASGSRNGNLQITQFYYGAAQPSNVASQVAQALFYGSAQDDGAPHSDPNVLNNGNIAWQQNVVFDPATGFLLTIGDATGVAADQTGSAAHYQYAWPCCGGQDTSFFLVSTQGGPLIGQTDGLLQQSNGLPTPDPQWPITGGSNFAVNPINGNQIIMSSQAGRIFRTESALGSTVVWFEIGNPGALDSTYAPAVAFGAPDPNAPSGIGNLDNFLYAGTTGGHIFVTQDGGGATGNNWTNISLGLDGSAVQQIITDPTRGSRDAYAVTSNGVYFLPDSIALANDPTNTALQWRNITANLRQFMSNPFGDAEVSQQLLGAGLTSIQADWRYTIPNNPDSAAGPNVASHPLLYVAGYSGVYRSLDNGQTWSVFPNQAFNGSPVDGGYIPNAQVTSLTMSIGNVDVNTGRAIQQTGDPNILLASTYGRGFFAIRMAPVVFPTSVGLSKTRPAPSGSDGGTAPNGGPLVTVTRPVFNGVSEQTAFGNKVRITILDLTDPKNPRYIGGYDGTTGDATDIAANQTDAYGNFSVQLKSNAFTSNGIKNIGIQATDSSGTKGNIVQFSFTYQASSAGENQPPTAPTLSLLAADDTSHGLNITSVTQPHFVGKTDPGVTVALVDANGNAIQVVDPVTGLPVSSITSNGTDGSFTLQVANPLTAGQVKVQAKATNANGSSFSSFVTFTIKTSGPKSNTFNGLSQATDSGIVGDNVTNFREPVFIGKTDANTSGDPNANTQVDLLQVIGSTTTVLATVTAQADGSYSIQLPSNLSNGSITLETRVHDVAGNPGPLGQPVTVTIGSVVADYNLDGQTDPDLFRRTSLTQGTWLIQGGTPAAGIKFGPGGAVPFAGDFNSDGVNDLAYYNLSTSTWFIQYSQGTNLQPGNPPVQIPLGNAGAIPVVGNFSGSGSTEVAVYIPGQGSADSIWRIVDNVNGLNQDVPFGKAGDIPVPGDYDATGKDELAVYRPSTGQFLVYKPNDPTHPEIISVGSPNLVPIPGDYDNIARFKAKQPQPKTEAAVFNPSTGVMTIVGPSGSYTVPFKAGDIPAPGDYLGLGETEPAVFRPSTGQFIVYNPLTKGFQTIAFGTASDVPVLAPYSYRLAIDKATTKPTISLNPADDSSHGKGITNVNQPRFTGKTDPNALVDLINVANGNVLGTTTADSNGNYSVAPATGLGDGVFTFQTRAYGFSTDAGVKSTTVKLTIQTKLQVVSVTPTLGNYRSLPGGKIVVKFNHTLAGLTADDSTGASFKNRPFAVYLVPRGPSGTFDAPTGIDGGSTPIHATLVYHVNSDGTSTITLTPKAPLGTDVYLIAVSGTLSDLAGNALLDTTGKPGTYFTTFNLRTTPPNNVPLRVTSVTTLHGSVSIANNTIPQPDTIAITFNKSVNFLQLTGGTTGTVQLLAGSRVIQAAVAYSPTNQTVYLTPEEALTPGTKYTVRVDGSVSDDQAFPNPDAPFKLGSAFTTTFQVNRAGVGSGQSPFRVLPSGNHLAITPGPGVQNSPFGYGSIAFSEPLDMSSLGRYSVMLVPRSGGLNNNAFDDADTPVNAKLAFNPNTNTLIVVPTVPLGNDTYLYTIHSVKAMNGDSLTNPGGSLPIFASFKLQMANPQQFRAVHPLANRTPAKGNSIFALTSTATTSTAGQSTSNAPSTSPVSVVTPVRVSQRPTQASNVHDKALAGQINIRSLLSTRRGQTSSSDLENLASVRLGGN